MTGVAAGATIVSFSSQDPDRGGVEYLLSTVLGEPIPIVEAAQVGVQPIAVQQSAPCARDTWAPRTRCVPWVAGTIARDMVESAAAAVWACLKIAREEADAGRSAVIVTVLPDSADKYLSERFWEEE